MLDTERGDALGKVRHGAQGEISISRTSHIGGIPAPGASMKGDI